METLVERFLATPSVVVGNAVGDIDGDGILDIAAASRESAQGHVWFGTGQGNFGPRLDLPSGGAEPQHLALGDMNGDGNLDLLIANYAGSSVTIWFRSATNPREFASSITLPIDFGPQHIAVGDLNGDGLNDFVTANSNGTLTLYYQNTGIPGTSLPPVSLNGGGGSVLRSVVIADLNQDGRPDLVTTNFNVNTVTVIIQRPIDVWRAPESYVTGPGPAVVRVADLDADGILDLVVCNADGNTLTLYRGGPGRSGKFSPAPDVVVGGRPFDVAIVDLDGDGRRDLVAVGPSFEAVFYQDPQHARQFLAGPVYSEQLYFPYSATPADLDGDGRIDLVITVSESAVLHILMGAPIPPGPFLQAAR